VGPLLHSSVSGCATSAVEIEEPWFAIKAAGGGQRVCGSGMPGPGMQGQGMPGQACKVQEHASQRHARSRHAFKVQVSGSRSMQGQHAGQGYARSGFSTQAHAWPGVCLNKGMRGPGYAWSDALLGPGMPDQGMFGQVCSVRVCLLHIARSASPCNISPPQWLKLRP
jgi:hypothetical protein